MTSWVSWEPGMKRLQATPAQQTLTHPNTQRAFGQLKPPWEYGSVEE